MEQIALVGITTVMFGIASLILISRARNKLTEGSIRRYMDNFAICIAFIVIFSLWQTIRFIKGTIIDINGNASYLTYPEYIFMVFAYIAFVIASFRVVKISNEFGFKEEGKKIEQIIKQKQSNSIEKIPEVKKFRGKKTSRLKRKKSK